LVVTLNDLANTVGPAMQTGKSITISVAHVNQPPKVSGPTSVTRSGGSVVFSGANLISVADPEAGTNVQQVTLTVTTGTLTLGSTSGRAFVSGNGTSSITIQGTLSSLNNALNGLLFTGAAATLTVTATDLGDGLTDTLHVNIL
jgi:hypothetical protein